MTTAQPSPEELLAGAEAFLDARSMDLRRVRSRLRGREPTTRAVIDSLYAIDGETLDGRIPPLRFPRGSDRSRVSLRAAPLRFEGRMMRAPLGTRSAALRRDGRVVPAAGRQPTNPGGRSRDDMQPDPPRDRVMPSVADQRAVFSAWLDGAEADLRAARERATGSLASEMAYNRQPCSRPWDEGFSRWGWPEEAGGFGGPPMLRAVVAEELSFRGLVHQNIFTMPEILRAGFALMASPHLVGRYRPSCAVTAPRSGSRTCWPSIPGA